MEKRQVLEDIAKDAQQNPEFFEDVLAHSGMSQRSLMQMYMIYKFKWSFSERAGTDLGWDKTLNKWVDEGYALYFDHIYTEILEVPQAYERMLAYDSKHRHKKFDT